MRTLERPAPAAGGANGYPDLFLPPGIGEYPRTYGQPPPTNMGLRGGLGRRIGWHSLMRYRWFALSIFLVLAIPASLVSWFSHVPKYRSYVDIEIPPTQIEMIGSRRDSVIPLYRQHLATRAAQLRSPDLLQRVLDRSEVRATKWFAMNKKSWLDFLGQPSHVERLLGELEVRPQNDANFIRVAIETENPKESATIVGAVMEEFTRFSQEQSSERGKELRSAREGEIRSLENAINGIEEKINMIRTRLGTDDPAALLDQQRRRLEELKEQQAEKRRLVEVNEKYFQSIAASAAVSNANGTVDSATRTLLYENDAEWVRRKLEVSRSQAAFDTEAARLGPANPRRAQLQRGVDLAKQLVQEREEQIDRIIAAGLAGGGTNSAPVDHVRQIEFDKNLIGVLERDIQELDARVASNLKELTDLEQYKRQLEEKRKLRTNLKDSNDLDMLQDKAPNMVASLMRVPLVPNVPSNGSRRFLMAGLAIFGAAGVALALTFVRLLLNPQVHETSEVLDTTQTPILGFVPLLPDPRHPSEEAVRLQTEYFRMIRTSLFERLPSDRGVVILVSSAGAGAGKTTVTEWLGRSMAQCGKRVLLVDADLRRQALGTRLEVSTRPGLVELLSKSIVEKDAIISGETGEPDLLPAGQLDNVQNAELLAGRGFKDLLQRWREKYDLVLLDGPPLLPVADARIMAASADGALLVVREGHCRRSEVTHAVTLLCQATRRFLGTVFFGSPRSANYPSYYASYYNYYGGNGNGRGTEIVAVRREPTESIRG